MASNQMGETGPDLKEENNNDAKVDGKKPLKVCQISTFHPHEVFQFKNNYKWKGKKCNKQ